MSMILRQGIISWYQDVFLSPGNEQDAPQEETPPRINPFSSEVVHKVSRIIVDMIIAHRQEVLA